MVLCNTCYLIKTRARQLRNTKNPKEMSETTITYDLAHYTFRVFILLQWILLFITIIPWATLQKGKKRGNPARWQRNWLKEQRAATTQDFHPSSAAGERERAGWWPWSHSCQALNHRTRRWMLQMVSVELLESRQPETSSKSPLWWWQVWVPTRNACTPVAPLQHMSLCLLHLESDAQLDGSMLISIHKILMAEGENRLLQVSLCCGNFFSQ